MLHNPKKYGILTFEAGEDLTAQEGKVATLINSNTLALDGKAYLHAGLGEDQERPFGIILQGAAQGEQVTIAALGNVEGTLIAKCQADISNVGALVISTGTQIEQHPHDTGAYWVLGTALETGVAGEMIEFAPCWPVKLA